MSRFQIGITAMYAVVIFLSLSILTASMRVPRWRSRLVVLLGSITPIVVQVPMGLWQFIDEPTLTAHPYEGVLLPAYLACLLLGALLSLIPKPSHLLARYILAVIAVPVVGFAIAWILEVM